MRAATYLRQSQDRLGDELGISRQREDVQNLISQRGWTPVVEFSDNDVSASGRKTRPGFRDLIGAIEDKRVDVVVAWNLDRLTRNARDRLALVEACQRNRVQIAIVRGTDIDPTTPGGRLHLGILGEVAQHEIDQKSDRQSRAQLQAAQQGKRAGGRIPFGYEDDAITIREDEAELIRRAYQDVLSGVSVSEIARDWTNAGYTTRQKRYGEKHRGEPSPWRRDAVRRLLINPRNAGLRAYRGEIMSPAVWPGIVPEETWRAAVDVLTDPSRTRTPTRPKFLLTGVALCGDCGATVHGGGARRHYRTYRCSATNAHVSRMAEPIEKHVADVIVRRLAEPDAIDLLVDQGHPDVDALREEATALRTRMETAAGAFADGDLSIAQVRTINDRCTEKLAGIEAQIADAGRVDVLGPLVRADDVREAWDALRTAKKRVVVDTLMAVRICRVGQGVRTFRPESVEIVWKLMVPKSWTGAKTVAKKRVVVHRLK